MQRGTRLSFYRMKFGCMMVFFETVLRRENTISPLTVLLSFPGSKSGTLF